MNKTELIAKIAENCEMKKKDVEKVLTSYVETIETALKNDEKVSIVGFGTSCPELVVSLTGAIAGSSDISAGNVIGSNIFNTLLILGLTAVISPIAITRENKRRDIPMTIAFTVLFILCGMSQTIFGFGTNGLSRLEGVIFLILFVAYIYSSFKFGNADEENGQDAACSGASHTKTRHFSSKYSICFSKSL